MQAPVPELDAISLVFAPLAMLLAGAFSLMVVNQGLRGLEYVSTSAFGKQSSYHASARDFAVRLKPILENLFGTSKGFTVKLEHLLLAGILVALVGMWRTQYAQAELARKEAKRIAVAAAKENSKGEKKH